MPICPSCKTHQNTRKKGKCPECDTPVELHKGDWYFIGTGSPAKALLRTFEECVSDQLTANADYPVVFSFPEKGIGYKLELISAGRLVALADNDLELAKEALKILFTDRKFSWKLKQTMAWIEKDFVVALSMAYSRSLAAMADSKREQQYVNSLSKEEDLFS